MNKLKLEGDWLSCTAAPDSECSSFSKSSPLSLSSLLKLKMDTQGRFIILVASIDNVTYTIVNIYAPNKNPNQFIWKLITKTQQIQEGFLIFCDFNAPMDPAMDTSKKGNISRRGLTTIFSLEDMYDPWRCLHTTEKDYNILFTHSQIII